MKMKTLSTVIMALVLGLGALSVACSTGASKQGKEMAESGQNTFHVDAAPGMSLASVEVVILDALSKHGWTVVKKAQGEINADLDQSEKRGIHGILDITYTDKLITIKDNSLDKEGQPFVAVRWVKYLMGDMQAAMGTAEPAK